MYHPSLQDNKAAKENNLLLSIVSMHNGQSEEIEYCGPWRPAAQLPPPPRHSSDTLQIKSWRNRHNTLLATFMWGCDSVRMKTRISLHDNLQRNLLRYQGESCRATLYYTIGMQSWILVGPFLPLTVTGSFHEMVTKLLLMPVKRKAAVVILAIKNIKCLCLQPSGSRLQIQGWEMTQQFPILEQRNSERKYNRVIYHVKLLVVKLFKESCW